jgi:hypothetical protein
MLFLMRKPWSMSRTQQLLINIILTNILNVFFMVYLHTPLIRFFISHYPHPCNIIIFLSPRQNPIRRQKRLLFFFDSRLTSRRTYNLFVQKICAVDHIGKRLIIPIFIHVFYFFVHLFFFSRYVKTCINLCILLFSQIKVNYEILFVNNCRQRL